MLCKNPRESAKVSLRLLLCLTKCLLRDLHPDVLGCCRLFSVFIVRFPVQRSVPSAAVFAIRRMLLRLLDGRLAEQGRALGLRGLELELVVGILIEHVDRSLVDKLVRHMIITSEHSQAWSLCSAYEMMTHSSMLIFANCCS